MKTAKTKARQRLSEDEKCIIRRAFSQRYHALMKAADKCAGDLWPRLYAGEAARTAALLKKLLGEQEEIGVTT